MCSRLFSANQRPSDDNTLRACAGISGRHAKRIASQIDAVFEDIDVDAVKIGMVSVPETIRVIADKLKQYQPPYVVIDPVMVATSGHRLLVPEAEQTLKEVLLPLADVLTPNLPEAEVLTGKSIESLHDMEEDVRRIGNAMAALDQDRFGAHGSNGFGCLFHIMQTFNGFPCQHFRFRQVRRQDIGQGKEDFLQCLFGFPAPAGDGRW